MVKIYTLFQTKKAKKTIPFGAAHTYIAYIREYFPGDNVRIAIVDTWVFTYIAILFGFK